MQAVCTSLAAAPVACAPAKAAQVQAKAPVSARVAVAPKAAISNASAAKQMLVWEPVNNKCAPAKTRQPYLPLRSTFGSSNRFRVAATALFSCRTFFFGLLGALKYTFAGRSGPDSSSWWSSEADWFFVHTFGSPRNRPLPPRMRSTTHSATF